MQLDKNVFFALAAIVWADGVVTDSEADALVGAARASGLTGVDLDEVRAATKKRVGLDRVKTLELGGDERIFVYAIAAWLTRADGTVTAEETEALGQLGDIFELSDDDRACAIATSEALDTYGVNGDKSARSINALAAEITRAAAEG